MQRRQFMQKAAVGVTSFGVGTLAACSGSARVSARAKLRENPGQWTFVGSKDWTEDSQGILYSPVWKQCIVRKENESVRILDDMDLLKREDFAYPSAEALTDTDLSVEFRTYHWSVDNSGIVFRAQDSTRFYAVEFDDLRRKGSKYEVRLYVQDASGYRRDIASGFAPHAELEDRWIHGKITPAEWQQATPGWVRARVSAQGDRIRVLLNDQPVIDVRDGTYASGRAGIVARGPVTFRNLQVSGTRGKLAEPWKEIDERPPYFYPWPDSGKQFGDNQTYPGVFRAANGDLVIWMGVTGDPHSPEDILLVRSRDEGTTWGEPVLVKKRMDGGKPWLFFGHEDGRMSCLFNYGWDSQARAKRLQHRMAYSHDGGKTWTNPVQLVVSGKPLYAYGQDGTIIPYSPIVRCSDGTLLQYYYHVQGRETSGVPPDRSLVIRSTDDGKTWTGPHYLDPENIDSDETMGAERADGSIIAFSRTLSAPFMWMSISTDKGLTWSKQVPSDCTGECPFLLRHSSGVLIMGSRGFGIFMKTSIDGGKTWSRETRISLCSGMMGMTEKKDGRILVVFHEAYRTPTRIRGHYMRVNKDGTLAPV